MTGNIKLITLLGHNPYFNRWFSAITIIVQKNGCCHCHNPYFNRWFSAIYIHSFLINYFNSHNPYFNRWFSAISFTFKGVTYEVIVTILILIDGFLQYIMSIWGNFLQIVTILILIDGFLQFRVNGTGKNLLKLSQSLF